MSLKPFQHKAEKQRRDPGPPTSTSSESFSINLPHRHEDVHRLGVGECGDPQTSPGSIFFCICLFCLFPTLCFYVIFSKESNGGLCIYDCCHFVRFRPLFYLSDLLGSLFCHLMYSLDFPFFFSFISLICLLLISGQDCAYPTFSNTK